jgi:hypothetical protein
MMAFESLLPRAEEAQGGIQLAEGNNERGPNAAYCCCAFCAHLRVH